MSDKASEIVVELLEKLKALDFDKLMEVLWPTIPGYVFAVSAALLPIYTGSWASLKRPSSAIKPPGQEDNGDDEENEMETLGFVPWDIVRIPLGAGVALTSLYYLIKYLDDPEIISKVLSAYFALTGLYSVTFLVSDAVRVFYKLTFPSYYKYAGQIWFVDTETHSARPLTGDDKVRSKPTPLPGLLSDVRLPNRLYKLLWNIRQIPVQRFVLKMSIHRILADKTTVDVIDLFGLCVAISSVICWLAFSRPWYLSNLLGISFSYFAIQQLSPTSFILASMVLSGLLVYDVVMVFYTPMMVTVATKLDIPAKLSFPRSSADGKGTDFNILGLGDIILPGIVISLALRFDLYMSYVRRRVDKAHDDTSEKKEADSPKPIFVPHHKHWHNLFWTGLRRPLPAFSRFHFPHPYFTATIVSYPISMAVCWIVMSMSGSGQPALFYLVPGLLGALWLTALVRGEVNELWKFSEDLDYLDEGNGDKKKTNDLRNTQQSSSKENDKADLTSGKAANQLNGFENGTKQLSSEDKDSRKSSENNKTRNAMDTNENVNSPQGKPGDNVVALENKLKKDGDVDLIYFAISSRLPKPEVAFSSVYDTDAPLEEYGVKGDPKWVSQKDEGHDHVQKKLRTS